MIGISEPGPESDVILTREQVPDVDYDSMYDASFRGNNVNPDRIKGDVLGKYIICEEIGRGAFGVVHRAIERATNKNWAAKFIRCKPHEKEIVRHEIDIMNELHHAKLLQLHEAFDQAGEMVTILELLSGGELFDRLVQEDFDFTEQDCITYMKQICEGVRHMHRQNILHLDLKPENVMFVTKDSNDLKIIDFGLAQKLEEGKTVKVLFGTAEFCAPEIISFEPVSFSTDMWALGVMSYVILSGYSPFAGENDLDTFANITLGDFDFEDEVWNDISDDAKDFIQKLMLKDKSDRLTIDDALAHPWLNPREPKDDAKTLKHGAAEKKLTGKKLSTLHHKDYHDKHRHKEDDLDLLPIGKLSRNSAIFRKEGDDGVFARNLVMEMPPHAPVVMEPLTDTDGYEGSRVELTCKISGKPSPKITWFLNGDEILEDKKYHMLYKDNYASLLINDLEVEDAGKYRCKAVNEFGDVSTTGKLSVDEKKHRRRRKKPEDEAIAKMQLYSMYVLLQISRHDYDTSLLDNSVPPSFTLPLIDQVKRVGEALELTVTVTCRPEPDVTWYHNGKVIKTSERYDLEHMKGVYRLIIHEIAPEDAGQWQCEAVNPYGSSMCSCEVKVIEIIPEGAVPPKFTKGLEDTTIVEGNSVRLEVQVKGFPEPEIEWYKERRQLFSGRHFTVSTEGDLHVLTISDTYHQDTGRYMCRAVNVVGASTTEAILRVQKAPKEDELDSFQSPSTYQPIKPVTAETTETPMRRFKIETPPNFTAKLKDKTVSVGNSVTFTCTVTGIPNPKVTWYRDDRDVTKESRYLVRNKYGLLSLEIMDVTERDMGQFTCKAVNSEGEATCTASLEVVAAEKETIREPVSKRPEFIEPLHDIIVMAGEEVTFTCKATGNPTPTFKWQKDGTNITDSRRIYIGSDSDGVAELVIRSSRVSDSGLYGIMAQNSYGHTRCSASLKVKARSSSKSPPSTPSYSEEEEFSMATRLERTYDRKKPVDIPGGRPPHFTLALPKVIELDEGDRLHLDCSVEGYPKPFYEALKAAGEYHDNKGFAPFFIKHLPAAMDVMEGMNVQYDCYVEGDITLIKTKQSQMKKVTTQFTSQEFEGKYKDIPTMAIPPMMMGGAGASPKQMTKSDAKQSPRFLDGLEDLTCRTGSIATLTVVVEANPEAHITWFKDGKRLINSDHIEIFYEDGEYVVEIYDTEISDKGLYKCVAKNEHGSAETQCKLTLREKSELLALPTDKPGKHKKFAPKFVVELESVVEVYPTDDIQFVCVIDDTLDKVWWEKDGKELPSSTNSTIKQEADGTQQLEIRNVDPKDQGLYTCKAKTKSGEILRTDAKLVVKDKSKADTSSSDSAKPKFTRQLKDIFCKDGDNVTLECEIQGQPRPQITWYRESKEILDSQDFQISAIGDKCKLIIMEVFPEDDGKYSCKAVSEKGEATTSCQLLVEDPASFYLDSASVSSIGSSVSRGDRKSATPARPTK
ncbi:Myosin light chain kinase, smooth muscle,Myosin light chain kinase family member 4,Death-associated protein kinase 2,Myosin light chain kinase 3,Death-associated protein kinase 1,Death-associated protein kinase 3,Myosin light chain kinase 2, skeletal/cardiac muscle [Mytilus edulis]|uniref:Uncharacterized protein n=1 Tax=Mytilus edulis TaxID=6550 RepID=A0A8S3PVJ0_MYTED|nr:Myosin light chain kinase, smooth muscle,Myosin light chain kinase family member 4,Death-associated protein kinase 2,Myosin light chain kinase 3,Death-associated protein kinase 1,Death-associated protein kinase 3,Myosin light chain kinase 2, skeletal/cardiac muscle [Mytilus edulis]